MIDNLEKLLADLGEEPLAVPPPRRSPPVRKRVKPTPEEARLAVDPALPMSQLIADICGFDKSSQWDIAAELAPLGDAALEQILMAQITAMNLLSSHLLIKAQAPEALRHPELFTALMGAGFRASEQCRKAILALHELRNPRKGTQFVKKQQVAIIQNHAQNLDTRTAGTPALVDSNLETVEPLNGSSDPCWQTPLQPECLEARCEKPPNKAARSRNRRTKSAT